MKHRMKSIPWKLRIGILFIIGFILLLSFIIISNEIIESNAVGKTFSQVEQIPKNRVGVVLGTSKYRVKGGVNLYFKYRVEAAYRLFKSGKIDFILVSGDNSSKYYNEPKEIKAALVKRGVPADKIYLDYAGFRTLDSVLRAKLIFGQHKFTLISQQFQNERAIYLANKNGVDAIGYNAKNVTKSYGFKTHVREYFARCKAILDITFNEKPKFLGKKITIK